MSVIYTIGYEGADIERVVRTLKAAHVARLVDVRAVAASRKKGFSKKALAARLADESIEDLHLIDLGDPKPGRDAARAGQHDLFRAVYAAHLGTEPAQAALHRLKAIVQDRPTCLLCFERDPRHCHRSIVAQEVTAATGLEVLDLIADDPAQHVRDAPRQPRLRAREGAATA